MSTNTPSIAVPKPVAKVHVMLDLETMSTASNAAIVSIGAVKFNVELGIYSSFYVNVDLESCIQAGLKVDGGTVMFWMQQEAAAREALQHAPLCIHEALSRFSVWVNPEHAIPNDIVVWGNGANFDNKILGNAYSACNNVQPWQFYNDRCYRTVKNLYPDIKLERIGTLHNAADDARSQAMHLLAIADRYGIELN